MVDLGLRNVLNVTSVPKQAELLSTVKDDMQDF